MNKHHINRRVFLLLTLILMIKTSMRSCDCISNTEVFIDDLPNTPLVIHGKIIKHMDKENGYFEIDGFMGITQIEVIHDFKGDLISDTIIHINTDPTSCGVSINSLEVNQEVFLKADFRNDFNFITKVHYQDGEEPNSNTDSLILEFGKNYKSIEAIFCEPSIIPVVNGKANGRIDHNPSKEWKEYKKLQKLNPQKAKKYKEEFINYENTFQRMPVRKMYSVIRNKLKYDR